MLSNEIALTASFRDNVQYNLFGNKAEPNPEKSAWYVTRGLITDDIEAGTKVMEATAAQSKAPRCAYHFSIDWHVDESDNLTPEKAIKTADKVLSKLRLSNHQAMYFWHTDADHPHMHIVVNRVSAITGKARDMWKSKERLERATHEVAREMGFMEIPGRHNELPFEADKEKGAPQSKEERIHAAELTPWVREEVATIKDTFRASYLDAKSWGELENGLSGSKLYLREKGQGLIVTDGTKYAKLSQMGKDIRLHGDNSLNAKYGEDFADHKNAKRESEQQIEEEVQNWFERLDDYANAPDDTADPERHFRERGGSEMDKNLDAMFDALARMEDFEKAFTVQKSADKFLKAGAKVHRQEWLLNHAEGLLTLHNERFNQMLVEVYKDPEEAEKAIRALSKEGQLKKALKASGVKKERWRVIIDVLLKQQKKIAKKLGKRGSEKRKEAEKFERRIFYRFQKIREAQGRITDRKKQLTQAKFDVVNTKTAHDKNLEQRERLSNLRDAATTEVTRQAIFKSDLLWRDKGKMIDTWHAVQKKDKTTGKSKKKDLERDDDFER